jgi:hypothetical protein
MATHPANPKDYPENMQRTSDRDIIHGWSAQYFINGTRRGSHWIERFARFLVFDPRRSAFSARRS